MFELFSLNHMYNIVGYTLISILFLVLPVYFNKNKYAKTSVYLILTIKISEIIYRYFIIKNNGVELLPLHLCNLGLILALITMYFKSYAAFEILYFWSIGAFFALLTPEVRNMFPSILNITFFTTHLYLFYVVLYGIIYWNFKPTKGSLFKSITYLNIAAILIFFINPKLGTNFMFINYKPDFSSPLDYFGPWPYYLIVIQGITITLFTLAYLPYRRRKRKLRGRFA